MNEWMTNIIGKFFSLISNILDAKHEKIIWYNQNFCFISKFLPIFKLERFRYKQKKILVVSDNFFLFSIQDN